VVPILDAAPEEFSQSSRFQQTTVTLPMPAGAVRSLNLAVAAGVALYEALRQVHGW